MDKIIIPAPLQIVMDDLGWFNGTDGRKNMEPARTGVTRRHTVEDYEVVNEIGRQLGMRINGAFVLGEWDCDRRSESIPHLSRYGRDRGIASGFDEREAKSCADVINSSEFIDFALHGLYHSYYVEGGSYNNSDYYFSENGRLIPAPEDEIRMRLDCFYGLMEQHGLQKTVNSFVPPCFHYQADHIAKILKDYGIIYASTVFKDVFREDFSLGVALDNGITVVDRSYNPLPWNAMECYLDGLPVARGVFGCHWANVCCADSRDNFKLVDSWVKYFRRCQRSFGVILSKDIGFCAAQSLYGKYSRVTFADGKYTVDISALPMVKGIGESFFISSLRPLTHFSDCDAEIYEKFDGFINYKVTPKNKIFTLE